MIAGRLACLDSVVGVWLSHGLKHPERTPLGNNPARGFCFAPTSAPLLPSLASVRPFKPKDGATMIPLRLIDPGVPIYEGNLECDLRLVGRNRMAEHIFPVSHPGKIPCPSWGLPASRCRTGNRLERIEGSVCHPSVCYAKSGRFRFKNVQARLELAYQGMFHPLWVPAAIFQINWRTDDYFRWFHSGDINSISHLRNIITVCRHTPHVTFWLPTRERETVLACRDQIPGNLRIRASATMVDGDPPTWWPMTSTVSDVGPGPGVCPAPEQDHECRDCRDCVDPAVPNVTYRLRVRPVRTALSVVS